VTADGFIPSFETGVYFDSFQSQCAMGLFQLEVVSVLFDSGGDRRRRGWAASGCRGLRDLFVIFPFFRVLCVVWLGQLSLYPFQTFLYSYMYLYVFHI
jgi:hypothetical protein